MRAAGRGVFALRYVKLSIASAASGQSREIPAAIISDVPLSVRCPLIRPVPLSVPSGEGWQG